VRFLWKCRHFQAALVCRRLFCGRFRWSEGWMYFLQSYVQVLVGYDTAVRHDMTVDLKSHTSLKQKSDISEAFSVSIASEEIHC
jgi:hypothetical protein